MIIRNSREFELQIFIITSNNNHINNKSQLSNYFNINYQLSILININQLSIIYILSRKSSIMGSNYSTQVSPWNLSIKFYLGKSLAPNNIAIFSTQLIQYSIIAPDPYRSKAYQIGKFIALKRAEVITPQDYLTIVQNLRSFAEYICSNNAVLQGFMHYFDIHPNPNPYGVGYDYVTLRNTATISLLNTFIRAVRTSDSESIGGLLGLACALNEGDSFQLLNSVALIGDPDLALKDDATLSIIFSKICQSTGNALTFSSLVYVWLTYAKRNNLIATIQLTDVKDIKHFII